MPLNSFLAEHCCNSFRSFSATASSLKSFYSVSVYTRFSKTPILSNSFFDKSLSINRIIPLGSNTFSLFYHYSSKGFLSKKYLNKNKKGFQFLIKAIHNPMGTDDLNTVSENLKVENLIANSNHHSEINSVEVIKPLEDKKSYRVIKLSNGLTAILIHDPEIILEEYESENADTKNMNDSMKNSDRKIHSMEESEDEENEEEECDEEGEDSEWEEVSDEEMQLKLKDLKTDVEKRQVLKSTGKNKGGVVLSSAKSKGREVSSSAKVNSKRKIGRGSEKKDAEEDEEDDEEGDSEDEDEYEDEDDEDYEEDDSDDEDEDEDDIDDDHEEENSRPNSNMKSSKKAAAAMCVGVGNFSDPKEAQGLAHYLEHMLFMGSEKYPDENEYDRFLTQRGGNSNAFTETYYTCFYFDVTPKFILPALDRFAQFFISPLAKVESMEREVLAVDSEFEGVLQSDGCRLQQLQFSTTNQNFPFNPFSWGNKKSLVDEPKEKGIDIRKKLFEIYFKYYKANNMTLALLSGNSLDEMEKHVKEIFAGIKQGEIEKIKYENVKRIWRSDVVYVSQSVKESHLLSLSFLLPCLNHFYKKKPNDYISHLIGHEGKGSLLSLLKSKGLATSLSAGMGESGYERNPHFYVFSIQIFLTLSGLKQYLEVIGYVFQYIYLLKNSPPQFWVFEELKSISEIDFRFNEEICSSEYAVTLATNLLLYSPEDVIFGDYVHEEFDVDLISEILTFFDFNNLRIDLTTKNYDFSSPDIQTEPWFFIPYKEEKISEETFQNWKNLKNCIHPSLSLPEKNEFIPKVFSVKFPDTKSHNVSAPIIISNNFEVPVPLFLAPNLKLWHKKDDVYFTPRANSFFCIHSFRFCENEQNFIFTELFVKLLEDSLNETLYLANVAKLETSFSVCGNKIEIRIFGFNDKLHFLAKTIFRHLKTFSPSLDRFQVIRESLIRHYQNSHMKPLKHSTYLRLKILKKHALDAQKRLLVLKNMRYDDLIHFIPTMFDGSKLEILVHGNLTKEESLELSQVAISPFAIDFPSDISIHSSSSPDSNSALGILNAESDEIPTIHQQSTSANDTSDYLKLLTKLQQPIRSLHHPDHFFSIEKVVRLHKKSNFLYESCVINEEEENSSAEIYFQGNEDLGFESIPQKSFFDLFEQIVYEPFYDQLRTKEQLGYSVDCHFRITHRVFGMSFRILSSKYSPYYLHYRMDSFLKSFRQTLEKMDDSEFNKHRESLIAQKLQKDNNLLEETDNLWEEIYEQRYAFLSSKLEAMKINTIQKEDLIQWFDDFLDENSPSRRKLSIHVWSRNKWKRRNEMMNGEESKEKSNEFDFCLNEADANEKRVGIEIKKKTLQQVSDGPDRVVWINGVENVLIEDIDGFKQTCEVFDLGF